MGMTLYLQIQTRFHKDADGRILTNASFARYEAWKQYLQGIDRLVLLARVSPEVSDKGHFVEGPGVSVQELPFYSGLGGLIRHLPKLHRAFKSLPENDALYGGRAADPLCTILQCKAKSARRHFIIQVVGDPAEALAAGVYGRPAALLSRPVRTWIRHQVRNSTGAVYVTREVLQARYPARPNTLVLARSNIELTPESFVDAPRDYVHIPPSEPFKLVTVGGHAQKFKGHEFLLEAMRILKNSNVLVTLTIIGGGRYNEYYKRMSRELDVEEEVTFTGHITEPSRIRQLISQSDLFILPSLTEGLSRGLIEAMAQGVACSASDVGGAAELLPPDAVFLPHSAEEIVAIVKLASKDHLVLNRWAEEGYSAAHDIRQNQSGAEVLGRFMRSLVRLDPHWVRPLDRGKS